MSVVSVLQSGVLLDDLDGDDDLDLVVAGGIAGTAFLENDGTGFFIPRTVPAAPIDFLYQGINAGDIDGDGDLDIYLAGWGLNDVLLRNDGDFAFTDITAAAGIFVPQRTSGATFGDHDGDGDLDIYVSRYEVGPSNIFYRNEGDGTFVDVTAAAGVGDGWTTFQSLFTDLDRDGDVDLFISNDKGLAFCDWTNRVFENVGGSFVERTWLGAGVCIDSMGIATGDLDGNGLLDVYCTNYAAPFPYLAHAGGFVFSDLGQTLGIAAPTTVGWGTQILDVDLDGFPDVLVANSGGPDRLFAGSPVLPYLDLASSYGLAEPGPSYSVVRGDIDLDGDIDLIRTVGGQTTQVLVNHHETAGTWLRLRVAGPGSRRHATGATVRVTHAGGDILQAVETGSSFRSQHERTLHFGLGTSTVAAAHVVWPGGTTREVAGIPAPGSWTLVHPDHLADPAGDGADLADLAALLACQGAVAPGCEAYDLDGDWTVGPLDIEAFLALEGVPPGDCDGDGTHDWVELVTGTQGDLDADGVPDECQGSWVRGDANADLVVDVADVISILMFLFVDGAPECTAAADANADVSIDIADPVRLLGWLFSGEAAPPPPFPECGLAPGAPPVVCALVCP